MRNLLIIVLFLLICGYIIYDTFKKPETSDIIKTDTIIIPGDTTFYAVYKQSKPKIDTVYVPDTDTLYLQSIDTMSVILDYFSRKQYIDTISGQETEVVISESIFKNRIEKRNVFIKNNRESKIITNLAEIKPRNKLFIGGGINVSNDRISYLAGLKLVTKKDLILGLDYNPIENQITTSVYLKIKSKR